MCRKDLSALRRLVLACGLLSFAACSCPPGHDPSEVRYPIRDGNYTQKSYAESGQGTVTFPPALVRNKALQIDRATKTVRVSYQREGKQIVETWRIDDVYLQ
jgi:hypothetical protein